MTTVLISGGTGMIGTAITKELLKRNYHVVILTRSPTKYTSTSKLTYAGWDIVRETIDHNAVRSADYIIHLAGAGLADRRWTAERKKEITHSRTKGNELIIRALGGNPNRLKAFISASGIGWYGAAMTKSPSKPFLETDPAGQDFLGRTCALWEASAEPVLALGKRLVIFRAGVVLSNEGGAFKEFKKPLRFGIAAILGRGRQALSWIHIDDLVRLYVYAIENDKLSGVYNAVAPFPVTNKNLVLELARQLKGKYFVPVFVPSFILKLIFGEVSLEVLKSTVVSDEKIKETGFSFLYPSIRSAIKQLITS